MEMTYLCDLLLIGVKNTKIKYKMSRLKSLLTTVLCLSMMTGEIIAQQVQDSLIISLDQAIEIALEESNSIKIADLTIEKSGYAKKGTYAALYPNISANGSYQRTIKKQVMAMDFGGQAMEIEVGKWNNVNAGISASMPLINAQLWQSLKLSALDVEIAVEQARSSKISMIKQVKQARALACPPMREESLPVAPWSTLLRPRAKPFPGPCTGLSGAGPTGS